MGAYKPVMVNNKTTLSDWLYSVPLQAPAKSGGITHDRLFALQRLLASEVAFALFALSLVNVPPAPLLHISADKHAMNVKAKPQSVGVLCLMQPPSHRSLFGYAKQAARWVRCRRSSVSGELQAVSAQVH